MRNILLVLLLFRAFAGLTQNITQIEYFVDSDPGYGAATQVADFTQAPTVSKLNFSIPAGNLGVGIHYLYVRARDSNGKWSIVTNHLFFKEILDASLANIVKVEYFIDADPGSGAATSVPFSTGTSVNKLAFNVPIPELPVGIHYLFVRAQDGQGKWSVVSSHLFFKELIPSTLPDIVKAEYFIDTDPGYGAATDIPVAPGLIISDLKFSISSLPAGSHKLFVRAKNSSGAWSIIAVKIVNGVPMPVTLVNFKAEHQENAVYLKWETTFETNSDRFEIQHSTDGKQWFVIGKVLSSHESEVLRTYSFLHKNPAFGENLYRLKMIDKDETFAYSRMVSITIDESQEITVFPNPARDKVTILGMKAVKQYRVLDINGAEIRKPEQQVNNPHTEIRLTGLHAGLYVIQLLSEDGSVRFRKVVIE